jgi:hypothetical protein
MDREEGTAPYNHAVYTHIPFCERYCNSVPTEKLSLLGAETAPIVYCLESIDECCALTDWLQFEKRAASQRAHAGPALNQRSFSPAEPY